MKIGFIGLGRMGMNMVLHLLEEGVDVVVYNRSAEKTQDLLDEFGKVTSQSSKNGNLELAFSILEFVKKLEPARVVWLMVSSGSAVDDVIDQLINCGITAGDTIIDGGNSFYLDSMKRANMLQSKDIGWLDAGVSGGLEGARYGSCIMVGGEISLYEKLAPVFESLIGEIGTHSRFGSAGAGHFVKMVHNGIEYGMLQAIAEGFELLEKSEFKLDLNSVSHNWTKGSVVRGWLMELLEKATQEDPKLTEYKGSVGGGETGEWTLSVAKDKSVSMPVLKAAVEARKNSQKAPTFAGKVISALRFQFGRHKD